MIPLIYRVVGLMKITYLEVKIRRKCYKGWSPIYQNQNFVVSYPIKKVTLKSSKRIRKILIE